MKRWIPFLKSDPLVAVVRLSGVISAGARAGLSDAGLAPVLERAFKRGKPAAVALVINSPGGSPAQSSLIAARIRRLADEKDVPVHAFIEDVAASGGYYLASAADKIWVDIHSVTGSIGVISAGFGFQGLIKKHGIERRVHTAGNSKSFMDPFQPEKADDVKRLTALQEQIHTGFIDHVKARRGDRLAEGDDLFNGDVWVGGQAIEVGLADGVAHLEPKMKELYGDKVRFARYGTRRSVLQRLGAQVVGGLSDEIEERALWARFGL